MNATVSYFCRDDEVEVLIEMFNKAYRLGLDVEEGIVLVYINLSGEYKVTIDDLSYSINFSTYSEYNDYTLEELEEQLSLIYNEF